MKNVERLLDLGILSTVITAGNYYVITEYNMSNFFYPVLNNMASYVAVVDMSDFNINVSTAGPSFLIKDREDHRFCTEVCSAVLLLGRVGLK